MSLWRAESEGSALLPAYSGGLMLANPGDLSLLSLLALCTLCFVMFVVLYRRCSSPSLAPAILSRAVIWRKSVSLASSFDSAPSCISSTCSSLSVSSSSIHHDVSVSTRSPLPSLPFSTSPSCSAVPYSRFGPGILRASSRLSSASATDVDSSLSTSPSGSLTDSSPKTNAPSSASRGRSDLASHWFSHESDLPSLPSLPVLPPLSLASSSGSDSKETRP